MKMHLFKHAEHWHLSVENDTSNTRLAKKNSLAAPNIQQGLVNLTSTLKSLIAIFIRHSNTLSYCKNDESLEGLVKATIVSIKKAHTIRQVELIRT